MLSSVISRAVGYFPHGAPELSLLCGRIEINLNDGVRILIHYRYLIDDPEIYDGAHVAVQLVGRRLQEEKMLALTGVIADVLGKHAV